MTEKIEEGVVTMCNLSDGVEQKGIEKGIRIGIERGIERGIEQEHIRAIQKKLEKNKTVEQIADELELRSEDVQKYITILNQ